MRARNLKPSIFKNELLATSDPLFAWVFEGLWCLADRDGKLEDRPRRIHLEINAGRAYEGTEQSLQWLADNGFILRYEYGDARFIKILNFRKHQNPHVREPESNIPEPDSSTGPAPGQHQSGPALSSSPLPDSPSQSQRARATATRLPDDFELTPERRAVAEVERLPADRTFAKFCDYWRAASGSKARKLDWDATWRNWCRTDADRGGSAAKGPPPAEQAEQDALRKLTERRAAIGLADFREPKPGETSAQYRAAQDAEWNARKRTAVPQAISGALKVLQ